MCIICEQFKEGKLTLIEAIRNYAEMKETLSKEHQKEMEEEMFNNFPFVPHLLEYLHDGDYWEITGFGD